MTFKIIQGDNRDVLKTIEDNSIDAIVTDPPYGIDFLGKEWDANTGALETYQECLRVLKPGGHILAFSAARTYHHLAITLEKAGFEIRDQIMWIYSSGFPKSQDVGRQLHKKANGKPDKQRFEKSELEQVKTSTPPNGIARMTFNQAEPNKLKDTGLWRHKVTGKIYKALPDINGDRLAVSHEGQKYGTVYEEVIEVNNEWSGWGTALKPAHEPIALARKPLKGAIRDNVLKHGTGALNIDATRVEERFPSNVLGEIPDYQKYFYCPKVSRKERHIGHSAEITRTEMVKRMGGYWANEQGEPKQEGEEAKMCWTPDTGLIYAHGITQEYASWCKKNNVSQGNVGNNHPTVKPVALMEYLIKLITPPNGTVLDPFNGSGSTGMAAVGLGYDYIGIELDPNYVKIAETRITAWTKKDTAENNFEDLFSATE